MGGNHTYCGTGMLTGRKEPVWGWGDRREIDLLVPKRKEINSELRSPPNFKSPSDAYGNFILTRSHYGPPDTVLPKGINE